LSDEKISVCHAPLQKFVSTLAQSLLELESWNFGSRCLLGQSDVLYTQNFIQIPTKKGLTLSFAKVISPWNKSEGSFGNYFGIQEHHKMLRILKFDILRVPLIQIPTKPWVLLWKFSPLNKSDGSFGNYFRVRVQNSILHRNNIFCQHQLNINWSRFIIICCCEIIKYIRIFFFLYW
jgi:hypothetical protein